jgi:hypothetical protein
MFGDILVFAFRPGGIGVHNFPDGCFSAFHGADASFRDFGKEFGSGGTDGCRADAFAVPAHGLPVSFSGVVGVPERVHAVEFSGAGIAFCGLTPEDAFKLGFVVFSGDFAAHGGSIPKCRRERNELIQNLSKPKNSDKNFMDNYAIFIELFTIEGARWHALCVAKIRPKSSISARTSRLFSGRNSFFARTFMPPSGNRYFRFSNAATQHNRHTDKKYLTVTQKARGFKKFPEKMQESVYKYIEFRYVKSN